jgi:hypothetical protein
MPPKLFEIDERCVVAQSRDHSVRPITPSLRLPAYETPGAEPFELYERATGGFMVKPRNSPRQRRFIRPVVIMR